MGFFAMKLNENIVIAINQIYFSSLLQTLFFKRAEIKNIHTINKYKDNNILFEKIDSLKTKVFIGH